MKAKDPVIRNSKFETYKKYKNLLLSLLRKSKNFYYKNFFETNSSNLQKVWKGINEIVNRKSKKDLEPKIIIHNGKEIKNDKEIAKTFNDFYGSVAEKLKQKIPQSNTSFKDYLKTPTLDSFFLAPTTPLDVYKIIQGFNENKAVGQNSIPSKILKLIAPRAGIVLSHIFNECFDKSEYPECLKKAIIKPLHKKDSKMDVGNYRPISLLSNINKILEKLLHTRLVAFLDKNKIIFDNQFGFRKKHSTNHAIVALTE